MNFEAKIIITKKWRGSLYGVILLTLFAISIIVICILAPKDILA
jgi:hypothetical protein